MTDFSLTHNTHTAPVVDSIAGSAASSAKLTNPSKPDDFVVDEEDYTIKCICGFQDDDGSTVYCERCETWQHIVCYYFSDEGTSVDVRSIDHNCADCEPRELDAKGAAERQSTKRRGEFDPRKAKKLTTKSYKKKSNPTLTNGWSHDLQERTSRSPKDQVPPTKKTKTSHKPSGSISLPLAILNSIPPAAPVKRSGSSSRTFQSPTEMPNVHSPNGYSFEPYSREFLHLYDDDPGDAPMQANLFNDINITRSLSSWSHDVESLMDAANGLSPQEIFHRCDQPLDSVSLPCLRKAQKEDFAFEVDGHHPRWRYLTIESITLKDTIVGELRGKIGHMRDYVKDPLNRWDHLRHPVPFVFFHPKLPIYIDTRHEGTICRYLRRSCRPNLSLKTILENSRDFRFIFVAKQDLEVGSELTIPWVLDEHIRNFTHLRHNEDTKQDDVEDYVIDWVGKVLAEFGGCACDDPSQCILARYDRRRGGSITHSRQLTNGKSTKGRNGYANKQSPPSTGYATNSRAGSEIIKHHEDEEHDDNRSTSGSMRSKPHSRDLTPTQRPSGDLGFVRGLELSDRDKRKIAARVKNFEQREALDRPIPKKKKRNGGGSALTTPIATASEQLGQPETSSSHPGLNSKSSHVEVTSSAANSSLPTSTSRRSSKPHFSNETSQRLRQNYVSSAAQTHAGEKEDWYEIRAPCIPRRTHYISLTKRLLLRCQKDREKLEIERNASRNILHEKNDNFIPSQSSSEMKDSRKLEPSDAVQVGISDDTEMENVENHPETPMDTEMKDVAHDPGPDPGSVPSNIPVQKPRPPDQAQPNSDSTTITEIKPPPAPLSSQLAQVPISQHCQTNGFHSKDLRVQPPTIPQIPYGSRSDSSSVNNPNSLPPRSQFTQTSNCYPPISPANDSSPVHPTPVKKKISVGEYNILFRRKAESQSTSDRNPIVGSVLPQNPPKAPAEIKRHSLVTAAEGTIADTTTKDPKL